MIEGVIMKRQEKYVLLFLLFALFVIRLYHINVPPVEIEESWRQADTQSMAWNFTNYDFHPFHPNLNYDGPLPNIPALEIQVTTFIIAILYKLFGHHYFLARLVPVVFFIISSLYLYLFARLHVGWRGAAFGLLVYGLFPINIYYSRAIMPESAALMFWTGGFYHFNLWVRRKQENRPHASHLIASAVFLSFAIMTKPTVVFVGIPMIYLCFEAFRWKWLRFRELWAYVLVTFTLSLSYYYFSVKYAEYKFALGIGRDLVLKKGLTAFYSPEAFHFFSENIPKTLGVIGFFLLFAGLFSLGRKQRVILVWFLAMLLEVILVVSPIRATYYLIFFAVPSALVIGNLLDRVFYKSAGMGLSILLCLAIGYNSYQQVKPMYTINEVVETQVKVVRELTAEGDLLVVGAFDPCVLSLADRRGWRYNLQKDFFQQENPSAELDDYIQNGAKYFVPIQGKIYGDKDGKIMDYIEERYPKKETIEGYPIYSLQ